MTEGQERALANIREVVALWYLDQCETSDIVFAACDLLVAGLDGPLMCELAAVSIVDSDNEVPERLADALREVGLECHPRFSPAALDAGLKAMAARTVTGAVAPRALARWAHRTFGHDTLEPAEYLAQLDDEYDLADLELGRAPGELDLLALAEAHRLSGK